MGTSKEWGERGVLRLKTLKEKSAAIHLRPNSRKEEKERPKKETAITA